MSLGLGQPSLTVQPDVDAFVAPGTGPYEFVFRPGEPNPQGNVYAVWSTLVADAALAKGYKVVFFDDTLAATSVPTGLWDFGAGTVTEFRGNISRYPIGTPLTFDDGARLENVFNFTDLDITSNTTSFVIDTPVTPTGAIYYYFSGVTGVNQLGVGGEFIRVNTAATFAWIIMREGASFTSTPIVRLTVAGAFLIVTTLASAQLASNSIYGVAGSAAFGANDSAASLLSPTQVGMPGGVIPVGLDSLATRVFYDDALVTPPTLGSGTVQGAIDKLKVRSQYVYAGIHTGAVGLVTSFFAFTGIAASLVNLQVPVLFTTTSAAIRVNVKANTLATIATVRTVKNGVATGPSIAIGAGATGAFTVTGALAMVPGDRIDLQVSNTGVGVLTMAAQVVLS